MSDILIALSTWLHSLATIIMIGYFVFTTLVYLPVFERQMRADDLCELLERISNRLRPFFGGSLLTFLVTGTHLMLVNPGYMGLGNFFANAWSILIIVKHVLVVPFIGLAVYAERAYMNKISDQNPQALQRFRRALAINTLLGMTILLLTSFAQAFA
jgi:uncharacterized membrane protein